MRFAIALLVLLYSISSFSQDITGIWRGHFVSDDKFHDIFGIEDRYKFEVQLEQRNRQINGVTYSYKTTVFYGKATANGTVNPTTGKVLLQELKIVEVRMPPGDYGCIMTCFLQYSKNGEEEVLEGKFSSYRESDSSFCGKGTVFLRKVLTSDFKKEPFLIRRELDKQRKENPTVPVPTVKKPPVVPKKKEENKVVKSSPDTLARLTPIKPVIPPTKDTIKTRVTIPVTIPQQLNTRKNELVKTIVVKTNEVTINLYDNGTIDHDTVSVYLDKKLVVSRQMLTTVPITITLKMDDQNNYHELVMVAENLGDIPPNTSLMVVKAGDQTYEVRITSTEQKNAVVVFKYEP